MQSSKIIYTSKHSPLTQVCVPSASIKSESKDLRMRDKRQCASLCHSLFVGVHTLKKLEMLLAVDVKRSHQLCSGLQKALERALTLGFVLPLCVTKIKFHKRREQKVCIITVLRTLQLENKSWKKVKWCPACKPMYQASSSPHTHTCTHSWQSHRKKFTCSLVQTRNQTQSYWVSGAV